MLAMFAIVTLLTVFKSGLKISGFLDFPIHSNMLPGPSACEVTALWCVFDVATLWRYTDRSVFDRNVPCHVGFSDSEVCTSRVR